jgi:hypothetical protein
MADHFCVAEGKAEVRGANPTRYVKLSAKAMGRRIRGICQG